ncbi:hypothetical protein JX265_012795 [Neoarthrinium moseri]|uniref:Glycosyltransferase family 31 protein n=1 Tax=Neoarthrinium moseri TaxID=1658444 RepID=A0A9P9W9Y1_9PEZI|nr:hypothetical protein JX266_005122 [Neoarthrinium moseri]KAI1853039.1 hypothetical protein JX265_012795 [Neoarthrinium moseri]
MVALDQMGDLSGTLGGCVPFSLSVPDAYPGSAKFPDLIFGMATTYSRLIDSLPSIAHWSSGRESKLIVVVEDWVERNDDVLELQGMYRKSGVKAFFIQPFDKTHSTSQSHFMVLTRMVEESGPETKWFGLLDDDTFYPHLTPLSEALGSLDHTRDMYVGGLAEEFGSIKNFGIMAYGGAGAYLSAALAKKLGTLDQATQCLQESPPNLGDIILRDCVYHHSRARLTVLPGFYQHDLLGDLRGFFESGVQPLNLHHWKSWYHEPVVAMAAATNFCGSCFLQRWRFGHDTVLSNGYSIGVYSEGLDAIDLSKMERTWGQIYGDEDPRYEYILGSLRDKVGEDQRKTYHLKDTEIRRGTMRQLYLRKGDPKASQPDEVIELIWRR